MNPFLFRNGLLHAENVPLDQIADRIGTPTYIYSRAALEHRWREFERGLSACDATIRYSVKSNSNLAVLALMAQLGSGFDVVSAGELERVIRAGGKPEKTVFSGVGKTAEEIRLAIESGIFSLNLESHPELIRICETARALHRVAPISVRVNPDIDANTHPHISTGLRQAKFGVDFKEALEIFQFASQNRHLNIIGIAIHIGSQMTSLEPIVDALERMIDFTKRLATKGIAIGHLDLGGGLGVRYGTEEPPTIAEYCDAIQEVLHRRNCKLPLSIEPGRAISANAGVLLSRIEYIKSTAAKNFALIDGGMNDLLRPVLYDAWMDIVSVQQHSAKERIYDVVGPVCETGDFLGKDRKLAIEAGDLIAVLGAGAYGAVMSSNYNTRSRPAEVLVDGSDFYEIRSRETMDQMLALERIPTRLSSDHRT